VYILNAFFQIEPNQFYAYLHNKMFSNRRETALQGAL